MTRRLPTLLVIVSLVLMALASGFHAHANIAVDDHGTIQLSVDDSGDSNPFEDCDQCECHLGCGHIIGYLSDLTIAVPDASAISLSRHVDRVRGSPHYPMNKPPKTIA